MNAGGGVSGKRHTGCIFIGKDAGLTAYTGDYNIAIGYHAMKDVDAGTTSGASAGNIFIGKLSGGGTWANVASNSNVCVGDDTLGAALSGALGNTIVGYSAGSAMTGAGGAGQGSYNVILGYDAQPSSVNAINQSVIGKGTTGQADNSVTIGNADVTAVYMAQDKGAIVHCEDLRLGDGGSIGSATTADVITMAADGAVSIDSSSADGQYDTQLSVSGHGDERPTLQVQANDGSYAAGGIYGNIASNVVRAANTAYNFYVAWADDGADIEFKVAGDGDVTADGSFTGSGADYAEFFESKDGEVIAIGTTVKLDGDKVVACSEGDTPIGVVRPKKVDNKASMTVGNTAWNRWTDKYLTDDFDRYILETDPNVDQDNLSEWDDGKRRKLNPDYDDTKEYKPREDRDEWHIIGLLGQIPITKGQPTGNWIKMKDVSDTVEMYFVK